MSAMHPDDRPKAILAALFGGPFVSWLLAAAWIRREAEARGIRLNLLLLARDTIHGQAPLLMLAAGAGLALAIAGVVLALKLERDLARGVPFRRHLRGTRVVTPHKLARQTRERGAEQVTVGGVPMPRSIETLHLLVSGSTGSGKSVAIRELAFSALLRGDRMVVADPNGDMVSKFWRKGDLILNPHDARGQGWTFFNEIRRDFDFPRYSLSLVPRGRTPEAEEWNGYGRLLLCETARKLALTGQRTIRELHRWTTLAHQDDLKKFLTGTAAESLFVGADKALASARFVLSNRLAPLLEMPPGAFSLRNWLERPDGTNLFITWREDMAESLRPLISAWIDTLCTSALSLGEDPHRRLWMFVDELATLDKLPSLKDAATKGRKAGLRLVAGIQSTAQLDDVYGRDEAQALRSCFRSLLALGGARTDPKTCEEMSRSLGEHEVEREQYSSTHGMRQDSAGTQYHRTREPVVLPSDVAGLPDLTGFLAFAGDHPIARVELHYTRFANRVPAFEERPC